MEISLKFTLPQALVLVDSNINSKIGVDVTRRMYVTDGDCETILRFIHPVGRVEKAIRRKVSKALEELRRARA